MINELIGRRQVAKTEAERAHARTVAQAKYDKEHAVNIGFKFNKKTDADILEWLSKQDSRQAAIKALIREAIKQGK